MAVDGTRTLALVISTMGPGGAERVASVLSESWASTGNRVRLITFSGEPSFYALHADVDLVNLDLLRPARNRWQGIANNLERVRKLRAEIKRCRPDVVLSFMDKTNVLVLLAVLGLRIPVIVSERTFPGSYDMGSGWSLLRRAVYRCAFKVVAVTAQMKRALADRGITNVVVIPNAAPRVAGAAPPADRPKVVMGAGRLEALKGFDVLIRAFAAVHAQFPDWLLVIAGRGELERELAELAQRCGVGGKVRFPGVVPDLPRYLAREVEVFVLSSRFEGFPNVLVEAMAAGKAVVATDCRSGPAEIVVDGDNGLLVPVDDVEGLGRALAAVMGDASLRNRLGRRARRVSDTFSKDKIMGEWTALVDAAIAA